MNLGELLTMLKLFPADAPILNAPKQVHPHQGKQGLAFVVGSTIFNQNPTIALEHMVQTMEMLLDQTLYGAGSGGFLVTRKTVVYLVEHMHHNGEGILALQFCPAGVRFIRKSRF